MNANDIMTGQPAILSSFTPGQRVRTSFGPGVVSAISYIDSILYVTLADEPEPLYLLRPEQVEPLDCEFRG